MPSATTSLLTCLTCLLLTGCATPIQASEGSIDKQILLKSSASWDGTPYTAYPIGKPELTLLRLKIPANTQLQWHTHPMPNAAYIVSGEIHVQARDTGHSRVLKQGQTLAEMVDIVHRGSTGDQPVELLVFYAGVQGMPLSEPH